MADRKQQQVQDSGARAWQNMLRAIQTWVDIPGELDQHAGFRVVTQHGEIYIKIGRSYDTANIDPDVAYPLVETGDD